MENGPLPPQKHHDAGSLLRPISSLLPSSHIGGGVIDGEEMLAFVDVFETFVGETFPEPDPLEDVCRLLGPVIDAETENPVPEPVLEDPFGDQVM